MVYHLFNYCIQGIWYRDSFSLSDDDFERIMNALEGKVPANVKIYHYGVPGRKRYDLTNPVILDRPVLSLNPFAMAQARIQQPASIYDKQRREVFPAIRRLGRYVIYQGANDWPKLSYLDGNRLSMMVPMEVAPVSLKEALDFVRRNHRHCAAPQGHKFSVGLTADGALIGVVIASTPKARALNDGRTLELNRICCDPVYRNAVSKVSGAAIRAARAMGYRRIVTYTLPQESGSSMLAVGFRQDGMTAPRPNGWNCRSRPRKVSEKYPGGEKIRWILNLE